MSGRGADGADAHPPTQDNLASTTDDEVARLVTPTIVNTVPTPRAVDQHTESYFTQRPAESQISQAAVPSRQRSPSTTPSVSSSAGSTSSALREAIKSASRKNSQIDLGTSNRPSIFRDLSHASATSVESTESSATVVPVEGFTSRSPSFSPVNYNAPFSAIHQPYTQSPLLRGGHPLYTAFAPHVGPASAHPTGSRTMDSTPAVTPGLFDHSQVKSAGGTPTTDAPYPTPYLHHLHTQVPKETYTADIDVDPVTGRKIINEYMIVDELGRGTHGKVKLGRHLVTGEYVAIKIVERFPKKRRLGRLGNAEDKVKREVAILKKARHENIVALLEVIDDPARRKVYIVLERVDLGEVPWRTPGIWDISLIEARRYDREAKGIFHDETAEAEDQAVLNLGRVRRAKQARQRLRQWRRANGNDETAWSIELAGDAEEESELDTFSRAGSSIDSSSSPELERVLSKASMLVEHSNKTEPTDLLATVTPANALALANNIDPKEAQELRKALNGTMYGAFDDPMSPPEELESDPIPQMEPQIEPEVAVDDANVDIQKITKTLSDSNMLERASDIIDEGMHPDLNHVPCMTMSAIRACFRDTVLGLMYLHFHGIIHRDIKPPNLLQTKDHRTKISDFGVSFLGKTLNDVDAPVPDESLSETDPDIDEAKELAKNVGTAAFYAPELCFTDQDGDSPPIGKAIDVWALGITLFCMVFARVPFVDTEYVVMRRIAEEEVYIPRKRLRPTEHKLDNRTSNLRAYSSFRDYRAPYAVEYEDIDDDLYDLLKALLNKDATKRVTLEKVKDFKWVTADLADPKAWKDLSAPNNKAAGDKIEVSREDVETSVVPLNLFDRVKNVVYKAVGINRSPSSASKGRKPSQDGSTASASSSSSNVLQYDRGRRPSLKPDEPIVQALKASRESERAIPASLAMTPVHTPVAHRQSKSVSSDLAQRDGSADSVGLRDLTVSSTGTVRTIRQKERPVSDYFDASAFPTTTTEVLNSPTPSAMTSISKIFKTARDRSGSRGDKTRSGAAAVSSELNEPHGTASVAVSTESALGRVNAPQALRDTAVAASPVSRQSSIVSTPDLGSRPHILDDSRSAKDSPSSFAARGPLALLDDKPLTPLTRPGSRSESTEENFSRAETELLRRQIAEGLKKQEEQRALMSRDNAKDQRDCPPSPDDELYRRRRAAKATDTSVDSIPPSLVPSLDTGIASPNSSVMPLMTPVSSEDQIRYEQTPATSDPSLESITSDEQHSDAFDNNPSGTIKAVKSPVRHTIISPRASTTIARRIPDEDDGYHGDTAIDSDDDDFDSSDSDGGLQIKSRPRPLPPPPQSSRNFSAPQSRDRDRRGTGGSNVSRKETRSSSINTMKKVPTSPEEAEGS